MFHCFIVSLQPQIDTSLLISCVLLIRVFSTVYNMDASLINFVFLVTYLPSVFIFLSCILLSCSLANKVMMMMMYGINPEDKWGFNPQNSVAARIPDFLSHVSAGMTRLSLVTFGLEVTILRLQQLFITLGYYTSHAHSVQFKRLQR